MRSVERKLVSLSSRVLLRNGGRSWRGGVSACHLWGQVLSYKQRRIFSQEYPLGQASDAATMVSAPVFCQDSARD